MVGNHTFHHVSLTKIPAAGVLTEWQANQEAVKAITGDTMRFCRPPGGDYDDTVIRTAAELKLITVLWTDDPGDYASPGTRAIREARARLGGQRRHRAAPRRHPADHRRLAPDYRAPQEQGLPLRYDGGDGGSRCAEMIASKTPVSFRRHDSGCRALARPRLRRFPISSGSATPASPRGFIAGRHAHACPGTLARLNVWSSATRCQIWA